MDTSEQYIKMCEKAKEIQWGWGPLGGDWAFYYDVIGFSNVHCITSTMLSPHCKMENELFNEVIINTIRWHKEGSFDGLVGVYVWLPRQDQLQEMLVKDLGIAYQISFMVLDDFIDWLKTLSYNDKCQIYSYEQLWLAFVIHKKYNKVWNGEDWIEEG